jgi:hypothetical protein
MNEPANEKRPRLFIHDNGSASLWFYVKCRSPEEVFAKYLDVALGEPPPPSATEEYLRATRENATFDIDTWPRALRSLERQRYPSTQMTRVPGRSRYRLEWLCDACEQFHDMDTIELDDGPAERASLPQAYSYRGLQIPSRLIRLVRLPLRPCPTNGKPTAPRMHSDIFVTPEK